MEPANCLPNPKEVADMEAPKRSAHCFGWSFIPDPETSMNRFFGETNIWGHSLEDALSQFRESTANKKHVEINTVRITDY